MKYSFRPSDIRPRSPKGKRRFRLAAYRCPTQRKTKALEQIPLIDLSYLFEYSDTPLLAPPKKRKQRQSSKKLRFAFRSFLEKLARKKREYLKRKQKNPSLLLGLLCSAFTVAILSAVAVLAPFAIKYFKSYTTVTIPDFTALTYDEILNLDEDRFSFVINQVENISATAGEIISQRPKPNATRRIYKKSDKLTVTLTVCAEENSFLMEDPTNMKARDVILQLKNNGVSVKVEEKYSDKIPKGAIISSSYVQGTPLNSNSEVTLTVSLGKRIVYATVPRLEGLSESQALSKIRSIGLAVGEISYTESEKPAGSVIWQSASAASSLPVGSKISLTVSAGSSKVKKVPDLYGLTVEEAKKKLEETGLVLGEIFYIEENENNSTVVNQSPVADTPISSSVVSVDVYIGK